MLYNIKCIPLHCVFHGIRFKVKEIDCRDDNQFFLYRFDLAIKVGFYQSAKYQIKGTTTVVPFICI